MKSRDTRTKACGEAQGTVTRAAMKSQEKGQRIKSIDGKKHVRIFVLKANMTLPMMSQHGQGLVRLSLRPL